MPDGSSHELRHESPIADFFASRSGIYHASDGSGLRYNYDSKTLYLPDGSRYVLGSLSWPQTETTFTDRNGNTLIYNPSSKLWSDTLGRPIPAPPIPQPVPNFPAAGLAPDNYTYSIPGVGNTTMNYTFRWKALADALTDPTQQLAYPGDCSGILLTNPPAGPALFQSINADAVCEETPSSLFNPSVLAEVVLPDKTSYKFTYNVYGEIDKVVYPTGGYERFEYGALEAVDWVRGVYVQANRGVIHHFVSESGAAPGEAPWHYSAGYLNNDYTQPYKVTINAPDGTRTERRLHTAGTTPNPWGFNDVRIGRAYDERVFSAANRMMRRTLTQWVGSAQATAANARDPRPSKQVEILLDTDTASALTRTITYQYDDDLNVTATSRHGFQEVSQSTARDGAITSIPAGPLLRADETTFLVNDPGVDSGARAAYRANNLVRLPSSSRVLDGSGAVVAKSEIRYDEPNFPLITYGPVTGWVNPPTAARGNPTTSRRWLDTTGEWVETHSQYDQCGSIKFTWDAGDAGLTNPAQVDYSPAFSRAYPTSVTTPAPDPTPDPQTGPLASATAFVTSTAYDFNTGRVVGTTNENDKTTVLSYADEQGITDPFGRLRKVTRPDGGWTKYDYGRNQFGDFVRTRVLQNEAGAFTDSYQYFDGLGRPYRSFMYENQDTAKPWVTRDTEYDNLGRVKRVSLPYRSSGSGDTSQSYPSGHTVSYGYDAVGRPSGLAGNLGDGVQRAYASDVTYSEFGGLQQERFGTQVPLYRKLHYNRRGQLFDVRLSTVAWAADQWNWNRGALINYYSSNYAWEGNPNTPAGPDNNGNVLRQEHWAPADEAISNYAYTQDTYGYDSLNRLTSVSEVHGTPTGQSGQDFAQVYDYDRWGNRTLNTAQTSGAPKPQFELSPHTNQEVPEPSNRLYAQGDAGRAPSQKLMRYDAAGNLTHDAYTGNGSRLYDAENRIAAAYDSTGNWAFYTYDAEGRRVKRKVRGEETWQVYGVDGELLAEYRAGAAPFLASKEYGYRGGGLLVTMSSGDDLRLRRFVKNLYYNALARDPSAAELQQRSEELAQAGAQGGEPQLLATARSVARGLFVSAEYVARGRTDAQYVTDLYHSYLQRGPDTPGLNHWIGHTQAHGRQSTLTAFEGCTEFTTLAATVYGTAAGGDNQRVETFVRNFYLGALQREPTTSEMQQQSQRLNGAAALGQTQVVAEAQAVGGEIFQATNYNSSATDPEYVTDLYEAFLQRAPDGPGLNHWVNHVQAHGRASAVAAFKQSTEYKELAGTLYREAYWLVGDHLGTPRMLADRTGSLAGVRRRDYLPFGEKLPAETGGRTGQNGYKDTDNVRQQFTQKEKDGETNLDFFLTRYYSSAQGRFTSPDEVLVDQNPSAPQSWNLYSYVGNSPLSYTDPFGLWRAVPCNYGGTCYEWENENDTWASLAQLLKVSVSSLTSFFAGATLGEGVILDTDNFTRNYGRIDPRDEIRWTAVDQLLYEHQQREALVDGAVEATKWMWDAGPPVGLGSLRYSGARPFGRGGRPESWQVTW